MQITRIFVKYNNGTLEDTKRSQEKAEKERKIGKLMYVYKLKMYLNMAL